MFLRGHSIIVRLIWFVLSLTLTVALFEMRWSLAFIALVTLLLTMMPQMFADRIQIKLPVSFIVAIVIFIFGTIFLGEAFDFYNRYWWWDILLHAGSALGFGLVGFLFIFMLFEGDRYAAPPWAIAILSYCVAITIGATWEVFEFFMDMSFGLNMQKSGLVDTMWDMIVDMIGASIGALAGYFYLIDKKFGGFAGMIDEFVRLNRRIFKKHRGD